LEIPKHQNSSFPVAKNVEIYRVLLDIQTPNGRKPIQKNDRYWDYSIRQYIKYLCRSHMISRSHHDLPERSTEQHQTRSHPNQKWLQ